MNENGEVLIPAQRQVMLEKLPSLPTGWWWKSASELTSLRQINLQNAGRSSGPRLTIGLCCTWIGFNPEPESSACASSSSSMTAEIRCFELDMETANVRC